MGEVDISTANLPDEQQVLISQQPYLGSLFKSQNADDWKEDLFEDIKFVLNRAEFDISRTASLLLTNEDLGYEALESHPVETNAESNTTATSDLFKNNNNVVKISHRDNGFDSGNSYVFFKNAENVGGITGSQLNTELYQVSNHGVDYYNITSNAKASANAFGGGDSVLATYNRKFEKIHAVVPNLAFSGTKVESYVKTTNVSPVDDNVNTFTSYSQTDYERTFLNEDVFFINQKMIASRINQIINNVNKIK